MYQLHEASKIHTEISRFIWKRMLIISVQIFNFHSIAPKYLAPSTSAYSFFLIAQFSQLLLLLTLILSFSKEKQNIVLLSFMQQMLNIALFWASEREEAAAGTIQIALIAQIIVAKFQVLKTQKVRNSKMDAHQHARQIIPIVLL